jgi:predicted amidophosphoribosyltransferase
MVSTESRGVYCLKCGWFSLRAAGRSCPSCGSKEAITERIGLICPACHRPTPSDDPGWRKCLECYADLPPVR